MDKKTRQAQTKNTHTKIPRGRLVVSMSFDELLMAALNYNPKASRKT